MTYYIKWFAAGISFALGLFSIAYIFGHYVEPKEEGIKFFQLELKGKLEIVKLTPTISEDRLSFNALVKNLTSYHFGYTWLRVDLYDQKGEFIRSCDNTTGNFSPESERWVQIDCGLAGYKVNPAYDEARFSVMESKVERSRI